VAAFPTIFFGQLDAIAFDLVDGTDVNAVGGDNFHVLFDFRHWISSEDQPSFRAFLTSRTGQLSPAAMTRTFVLPPTKT
jgi:hypothetical protein